MNESLLPKMPAINAWLKDAAEQLATVGIRSALLDAEILLSHTLKKSRTYLHAHGEDELTAREYDIANARLDLRLDRTPIAYIIGHKEFYGRMFKVTPSVLIPRPESEDCIHLLNTYITQNDHNLVDVGTGSGCLGITAKLEHPHLSVTISDTSRHALIIAKQNAESLQADLTIVRSDLLAKTPERYSCIIANLPYVDASWERSPETNFEPKQALFADDNGVALILKLLDQIPTHLLPEGVLILEADPYQHERIIAYAATVGLILLEIRHYAVAFRRQDY
jgi:release factor glutamine methyltransferase